MEVLGPDTKYIDLQKAESKLLERSKYLSGVKINNLLFTVIL